MKSLFVLAFLLCFSVAYGLKCYQCASTHGWSDCTDVQKEVTCVAGMDRCVKGYADVKGDGVSVEAYERSCSSQAVCNNVKNSDFCKGKTGKGECKIYCCSGDLCNAAATHMVSAIILIACTFVVLMQ